MAFPQHENGIPAGYGKPENDQEGDQDAVKEIIIIAQQYHPQDDGSAHAGENTRFVDQTVPTKGEEGNPFQRDELQMALGMHEVIIGKGEDKARQEAAPE